MSPSLADDSINLIGDDSSWWIGSTWDEDNFGSPLSFDATENGLWNGNFVPPPPRPPFLEESILSDGLTTCDMCSWATKDDHLLATNSTMDASGEWGLPAIMIVVSLISALIGAFTVVTFLKCRRMKAGNANGRPSLPWWSNRPSQGTSHRSNVTAKHGADTIRAPHPSNSGVWTWLGQRRESGGPDPLSQPSSSPAENHYTHMDDSYNPEIMGEALYAELDRESLQSGNPSYQNTAYSACGEADKEMQVFSSAPSSAYYSDLSVTTIPATGGAGGSSSSGGGERSSTYEIVGLSGINQVCPLLEAEGSNLDEPCGATQFDLSVLSSHPNSSSAMRRHKRLSAINENANQLQPSDFV